MHRIDPDHLPEFQGTIDLFLVSRHGEADGLLLTDGVDGGTPEQFTPVQDEISRLSRPSHA